ncbi:MAG: hypothetical protein CMK74_15920 [Pseudomonadales bacterium]|nr:hypothetical protein [Pseudomonadales bacterium]
MACGEVQLNGPLTRPDVGASSGNILFDARFDAGDGDRDHELVLRYQPADGLMNHYDMASQFRVQQVLASAGVKVAKPLCLDADGSLLGTPGYIMQRARGAAPRQYYYAQGPLAEADPSTRQALIADMMETLAQTHALDWRDAGLGNLRGGQVPEQSIGEEIRVYTEALRFASDEIADSLAGFEHWLLDNQPKVLEPVLNHGDFQPSNMLFADGKLVVALDWETARITAPESDLGWLMGVHSFARILGGGNNIVDIPSDADWLTAYERASGRTLQHWPYHLAKGAFCTFVVLHVFGRRMNEEERKPFSNILIAQEERMRKTFHAAGARHL